MIETFRVRVPAPSGTQSRRVFLYLPKNYSAARRFPVVYLFDGQTAFYDETAPFGESLRLGEMLDGLGAEFLVAAVECDAKDRLTEYSPFPFRSRFGASAGMGERYMRWLAGKFKPFMDASFFTLPDPAHTYLAGSSLGGLMSLYGVSAFGNVFGNALALSPSLWVNPAGCAQLLAAVSPSARVYLDYGEKELSNHARQKSALMRAVAALGKSGACFSFRIAPGGIHSETSWRERFPVALACVGLTGGEDAE